jgi:peptide/nickel transport system substrate-binding protein
METGQRTSYHEVKRSKKRRGATARGLVVAGLLVAILTAACSSPTTVTPSATATANTAPVKGGTLTVGLGSDVRSFDPMSRAKQQFPMTFTLYDSLLRYDKQLQPQAGLATQWVPAANGSSITLTLREGVKYHNGKTMTADDVVKNFDKARDTTRCENLCAITAPIADTKATDAKTVVITFKAPLPVAAMTDILLAMPVIEPSSMADIATKGVGTGPFKFVSWIPRTSITFEANKDYWGGGGPYLDNLVFKIFDDQDAMAAALQTGALDAIVDLSAKSAAALKADFNVMLGYPGTLTWELRLNAAKPPFDKKEVRQALQFAMNRQGIVDKILYGFSEVAVSPYGGGSPAADASLAAKYPFNLDKAKQMLTAAGVTNATTSFMLSTGLPSGIDMAQIIQADWAKIGINVTLDPIDPTRYIDRLLKGDFPATMSQSSNANKYPTGITLNSIYRIVNNVGWTGGLPPKNYLDAINELNSVQAPEAQKASFKKLSDTLMDESWVLSIARANTIFVLKKQVQGFDFTVDDLSLFEKVWIKK